MLRATAVALVEPHDIEAACPGFGGNATHVMRFARSLEPMQGDDGWMFARRRLPVTVRQDACIRRHIEITNLGRRQVWKLPSPGPRIQGHLVTTRQAWQRDEIVHSDKL